MKYKIEQNIPIPEDLQRTGHTKYPWPQMKLHDSTLINNGMDSRTLVATINNWRSKYQPNWRFSVRTVADGVRVWRIK